MDYQKIYDRLMERANSQNRKKLKKNSPNYVYYEKHHIIPDCFFINRSRSGDKGWLDGDPNAKENLILLTPEEHYLAHQLLVKIYPNHGRLVHALALMASENKDGTKNNKMYGWIRRKVMEERTKFRHSDKTKKQMSTSAKGKPKDRKAVEKQSESLKEFYKSDDGKALLENVSKNKTTANYGKDNGMYGKTHTAETKAAISAKAKGRKSPLKGVPNLYKKGTKTPQATKDAISKSQKERIARKKQEKLLQSNI